MVVTSGPRLRSEPLFGASEEGHELGLRVGLPVRGDTAIGDPIPILVRSKASACRAATPLCLASIPGDMLYQGGLMTGNHARGSP